MMLDLYVTFNARNFEMKKVLTNGINLIYVYTAQITNIFVNYF